MTNEKKALDLATLCKLLPSRKASFDDVKEWLEERKENQPMQVAAASYVDDESNETPLHHIVSAHPPADVVEKILRLAPKTVMVVSKNGSLPLHCALRNNASVSVISLLLDKYPRALKTASFPCLKMLFSSKYYKAVPQRLQLYLQQEPEVNYSFYCLLQRLPEDEKKQALLSNYLQKEVNAALGHPLPTFILMLDFYWVMTVIPCFATSILWYMNYLFVENYIINPHFNILLWVVMSGGVYFYTREVIQALSLMHCGYFRSWLTHPTNYIEVVCITILFVWPCLMLTETISRESSGIKKEAFRCLSPLASGFLFLLLFTFFKRIFIIFAVFVRGFTVAFYKLLGYILILGFIVSAFALMFSALLIGTKECDPFCDYGESWFMVYTMMFGNFPTNAIFGTDADPYDDWANETYRIITYLLYISFGVVVIIVLLNLLIAVVIEAYSSIKDGNVEEVFWSNRVDFVTEVAVISNLLKKWIRCNCFGHFECILDNKWASFLKLFEDKRIGEEVYLSRKSTYKCLMWLIPRLLVGFFMILWIMVGGLTCGIFWPPQVRVWLWDHSVKEKKTSVVNSIQELKRTMTFQDEGLTLESKLDSVVAEIKQEFKLAYDHMIAEMKNEAESSTLGFINPLVAEIKELKKLMEKHSAQLNMNDEK